MFSLRLAYHRAPLVSGHRLASTTAVPKPPVPDVYHYSAKKAWLSDTSTYPLLFALGFAGFFCVGMSANAFMNYKDVKINPSYKHQTIRDWGHEKHTTLTQRWASKDYHTKPEGLGRD